MTAWLKALALLLPGGGIALGAHALLRCKHSHEIFRRSADGQTMGLECWRCGRWRSCSWQAALAPRFRSRLERLPVPLTGIERQAAADAAEREQVDQALASVQRAEIAQRVRARFSVVSGGEA